MFLFQIVYIPESSGYVPVTSFRGGRPPPPIPVSSSSTASGSSGPSGSSSISASGTGSGSYHSGGYEIENWRPDTWDRDYNKRLRYNNTRVQRK